MGGKRGLPTKRNKHESTTFASILQRLPKVSEKGKVAFEKVDTETADVLESTDDTSSEIDDMECIACFEEKAELVFPRCGHLAYCKACGIKARDKQKSISSRCGS